MHVTLKKILRSLFNAANDVNIIRICKARKLNSKFQAQFFLNFHLIVCYVKHLFN